MTNAYELARKCVTAVLRPVITLAIRFAISYKDFDTIVRVLFVREASRHLERSGSKVNVMRISAVTGIRRDYVQQLLETDIDEQSYNSGAGKVVTRWLEDPKFRTRSGKPRRLTYKGTESEFYSLVSSINDIHTSPKSILEHLKASGLVVEERNRLKLTKNGYAPINASAEGAAMLGLDVQDLIEAVRENIFEQSQPPNLHLTTEYVDLLPEHEEEIKQWILERGAAFHLELRKYLSAYDKKHQRSSSTVSGQSLKFSVCTFSKAMIEEE